MEPTGRRGFLGALGALARGEHVRPRPPYAADETLFGTHCPGCDGACGTACEEAVIRFDGGKIPFLDFSDGGCTYCGACLEACGPGVLSDPDRAIRGSVRINALGCISWNGVMCFSCKEPCMEDAIRFEHMFRPVIDAEKCTVCGFCVGRCPSGAIEVRG